MRRVVTALAVLAVTLAGCSASDRQHGTTVVATTDVWGSVAQAVVGKHGTVTSILNSGADDPHSYEASPRDAATIADASLVVDNGGGYDHWVDDVLANHPNVPRVDAYSLRPDAAQHPNEHVFYDVVTAGAVAMQIAEQLAKIDAANADAYRVNAQQFGDAATEVLTAERAIGLAHRGATVAATEPVAHYLLANAGITDKTPAGFAAAIEQDTDPSPADVAAMLDLLRAHQVSVLLYNSQTETPVTKQIRDAATAAAIPIVDITETLPANTDYLTWQRQTVQHLATQLDNAPPVTR
jgi:zinc/manganese transport system substrate-binding protein